ncbi:MAG: recombinase family protein [Clostridia bacterium]|nr:recombinase family protein [Clostridia bacterium]
MDEYCLYLRKSRADLDAEAHGEGETLARHEKALLELARKLRLNVTAIHREIVSGETIAARPVMQQLLHEVEQGIWAGVLVMEVERLARGDTIDQGIVAQTFKYSDTKIITPLKTYNPNDEFDEEYFEFGLFMSRREYKTINRRLQRGRLASVREGKWVANKEPYGYERIRIEGDRGFTLRPVEAEADVVRLIYELYTTGELQADGTYKRIGATLIARRLNSLGFKSKTGKNWTTPSVRDVLINPVYAGKVRWNWRPTKKQMVDGQIKLTNPRSSDCDIFNGLHPAIISQETFDAAQEYMSKNPPRPVGERLAVRNPLSGLIVCGVCGRKMTRRPYGYGRNTPDTLLCQGIDCDNVSAYLSIVEDRLLAGLAEWLEAYKLQLDHDGSEPASASQVDIKRRALDAAKKELETLHAQTARAHDLLEQGVYSTDVFLERSRTLAARISDEKKRIEALQADLETEIARAESVKTIIPRVEHVIETYYELPDARSKNDMLKGVLEKAVYTKKLSKRDGGAMDKFDLVLYPKIPKNPD